MSDARAMAGVFAIDRSRGRPQHRIAARTANRTSDRALNLGEIIDGLRVAMLDAGIEPPSSIIADGELHRFPTSSRPGDTAGWYQLHADGRPSATFGDWRSGITGRWSAAGRHVGSDGDRAAAAQAREVAAGRSAREAQRRTAAALAIWGTCLPLAGSLAERYLASRGLQAPADSELRFAAGLWHPDGIWPGMLGLVRRGPDGEPVGIHRTYLARDGSGKAPVRRQKAMLGPCTGGAVRLRDGDGVLHIAEGIESAMSVACVVEGPIWAALSTSGLRSLNLPPNFADVVVLADGDDPGEAAAMDCARRMAREGRRVRIARPPPGMDFNDLLRASSAGGTP